MRGAFGDDLPFADDVGALANGQGFAHIVISN
jgi:hypothetical protein